MCSKSKLLTKLHERNRDAVGAVESGVEAKEVIQEGLVLVNGEIDTRRGRKLYEGDLVEFDGIQIKIEK